MIEKLKSLKDKLEEMAQAKIDAEASKKKSKPTSLPLRRSEASKRGEKKVEKIGKSKKDKKNEKKEKRTKK